MTSRVKLLLKWSFQCAENVSTTDCRFLTLGTVHKRFPKESEAMKSIILEYVYKATASNKNKNPYLINVSLPAKYDVCWHYLKMVLSIMKGLLS